MEAVYTCPHVSGINLVIREETVYIEPPLLLSEEFEAKGFTEKMALVRRSQHDSPMVTGYVSVLCQSTMAYTIITLLYLMLHHTVPHVLEERGEWAVFGGKVYCSFIVIQVVVNWTCTRYVTSYVPQPERRYNSQGDVTQRHHGDSERQLYGGKYGNLADCDADGRGDLPMEYCPRCQMHIPFRAHHCKVCKQCILKRDQHCFFIGSCIGLRNQRYFVVLLFYMLETSSVGLVLDYIYLKDTFTAMDMWDYAIPVALFRLYLGWLKYQHVIIITHLYLLTFSALGCFILFSWQLRVISGGQTSHEVTTTSKQLVRCTSSPMENFRSVFGKYWLINFIVPASCLFRQKDDGMTWQNIKIKRQKPTK